MILVSRCQPPETTVTKGRRKTNSTKRDKSHWEYVLGLVAVRVLVLILVLIEEVGRLVAVGVGAEDVVVTNWEEDSAPPEYWMDTPDNLYVIANTFNLCVVFLARSESTSVLPLVSNMDGPAGTIFIGLIEECSSLYRWMPFAPITGAMGISSRYAKPLVAWQELRGHYSHWEYSQDSESSGECGGVSVKVPQATVPRQKCSSRCTSCCLAGGVPPEAG
ncbi:hypothetical protein M9H77_35831 [Catharanthus roseus]|uniref:Uncharacterized protein n=1 Tax=Catharanthus roseus TaxID=4058 RepID=A0ACB9ZSP8_CATRO|nr:hypothetical protein M9H77_35831 [Catharanthus roseus]